VNPSTRAPRRAGASKGLIADRCRRTPRDHTREGRDLPRYYRVLRPPSQPLQRWSSISAPSQNTHASSPRDRERHQPAGPLEGNPWRVRGGERGQTWACAAPGSHPTATAAAGAPALGHSGGSGPPRAPFRTGSGARGGGVPLRKGPTRDTTEYYDHPPSPCRPDRPREVAALWARERPPVARGSAANIHGGGVGVLGAGPAGRGAPGRCVLLSTSCDPSQIARSNLPFLEPFSHRFLPRGRLITCEFLESPLPPALAT
jgi:hypothetical protein